MSILGASQAVHRPTAGPDGSPPTDDALGRAFADVRDELVSTLMYLLNDREDAQDAAQDAFLKCWRARHAMPDVTNLRAWIFRIGLNAAKDFQRSAWNRKAKPFLGDETMLVGRESSPGEASRIAKTSNASGPPSSTCA